MLSLPLNHLYHSLFTLQWKTQQGFGSNIIKNRVLIDCVIVLVVPRRRNPKPICGIAIKVIKTSIGALCTEKAWGGTVKTFCHWKDLKNLWEPKKISSNESSPQVFCQRLWLSKMSFFFSFFFFFCATNPIAERERECVFLREQVKVKESVRLGGGVKMSEKGMSFM